MSSAANSVSDAASQADSMVEGPPVDPIDGFPPPEEVPASDAGSVVDQEAVNPPLPALPAEAVQFLHSTMSDEAAVDIIRVLKKRKITTPAMLELLDSDGCALIAEDLHDQVNKLGLRALGRFYEEKRSKRRRTMAPTKDREFETTLRRLQDECAAKHNGFRVPGRFLLPPSLFSRLQKGEEVGLDQMVTGSAASGDTNHKLTYDTAAKTFEIDEVGGKTKPPLCHSAGLLLAMSKWGLSASLLRQLEPIHVLCYMARVAEACLNCSSGISVMKAIDFDLRSEARRGSSISPLGVQLAQEFGDIVARHSAAGQVAACLVNQPHGADRSNRRASGRSNTKDLPCRYFPLGKCYAGDRCKFKHVSPDAGRRSSGTRDTHQRADTRTREVREGQERYEITPFSNVSTLTHSSREAEGSGSQATQYAQVINTWCAKARTTLESEDLFDDEHFKDGGFGVVPGPRLLSAIPQSARGPGAVIGQIILDESRKGGLCSLLQSLNGAPSKEQSVALKEAADVVAGACRSRIADHLQVGLSQPENGNHIYCDLLHAIASALEDPDIEFPLLCRVGLPIGITEPIPPCSLYPPYHPKAQVPFEVPDIHRNYKSMKDPVARGCVEKVLDEEERCGFIRRLTPEEANDPSRTYTPRAALPKGDSPSDGYRIIDDFLRSNTNLSASVPNTNTLPGVVDLRRMAGSLVDEFPDAELAPFKIDLKSAYRQLGVRPSERRHLCFMHELESGEKRWYENQSLPFGLNSSAFWFVRFATLGQRCILVILVAVMEALGVAPVSGGLQYVDDGFWLLLRSFYYEAVTIIIMFWHLVGAEVSFPKVRVGADPVDCIGITVDMSPSHGPSFAIKQVKVDKLKAILEELLRSERISLSNLRSLTGKLTHYTQLRLFLRSYLQPFHALVSVMVKKGIVVAKCPKTSEIGRIASFFVRVLRESRALAPVGPLSRRMRLRSATAVVMVDASTCAVGGVLAWCAGGSSYTPPDNIKYFSAKLSAVVLGSWSCLLKDPEIPAESRNVTAFELLAACVAVMNLEKAFGTLGSFNVVMYTDNEAVRNILTRMYSKSPGLARLLRAMSRMLAKLSMTMFLVRRVPTEQNYIADTLSRCRPFHPPAAWEELRVSLESIPQDS